MKFETEEDLVLKLLQPGSYVTFVHKHGGGYTGKVLKVWQSSSLYASVTFEILINLEEKTQNRNLAFYVRNIKSDGLQVINQSKFEMLQNLFTFEKPRF